MTHRIVQQYAAGFGTSVIGVEWILIQKLLAHPFARAATFPPALAPQFLRGSRRAETVASLCGCCGSAVPPTPAGICAPYCFPGAAESRHRPHPSARSAALLPACAFLCAVLRAKAPRTYVGVVGVLSHPHPRGATGALALRLCFFAALRYPARLHAIAPAPSFSPRWSV